MIRKGRRGEEISSLTCVLAGKKQTLCKPEMATAGNLTSKFPPLINMKKLTITLEIEEARPFGPHKRGFYSLRRRKKTSLKERRRVSSKTLKVKQVTGLVKEEKRWVHSIEWTYPS